VVEFDVKRYLNRNLDTGVDKVSLGSAFFKSLHRPVFQAIVSWVVSSILHILNAILRTFRNHGIQY